MGKKDEKPMVAKIENDILRLVHDAENTKWKNDKWVIFGELTESEVKKLNLLLDADVSGFKRMIDISAIKHSRKKHPNLSDSDFCLIPLIVTTADEISIGKYPDTIVYKKVFEKEYYYVECIRTGRKRLAMKTMYKTKIASK